MVVKETKLSEAKMERCVCCGAELPYEGTLVCWECSRERSEAAARLEMPDAAHGQKRWKQQRMKQLRTETDRI